MIDSRILQDWISSIPDSAYWYSFRNFSKAEKTYSHSRVFPSKHGNFSDEDSDNYTIVPNAKVLNILLTGNHKICDEHQALSLIIRPAGVTTMGSFDCG